MFVDARTRPGTSAAESIISGINVSGTIQVTAQRVVIDGFTIQNNTTGPGIATVSTGSGYWIFNNVIRNNTFGIFLRSNGNVETLVRHNFQFQPPRPGAQ